MSADKLQVLVPGGGGGGGLPFKSDRGDRRTFKGLKFVVWYPPPPPPFRMLKSKMTSIRGKAVPF